jgi:hypothetical protein
MCASRVYTRELYHSMWTEVCGTELLDVLVIKICVATLVREFWEGIYICKREICSWMIKVGNDSFLQTKFGRKASETISQRRFLPKLIISKRKIHEKGRKRFFPTVSIRSESVWNEFLEKVFLKIKMIHISILSFSLNLVRKRLKRFLREGFW